MMRLNAHALMVDQDSNMLFVYYYNMKAERLNDSVEKNIFLRQPIRSRRVT